MGPPASTADGRRRPPDRVEGLPAARVRKSPELPSSESDGGRGEAFSDRSTSIHTSLIGQGCAGTCCICKCDCAQVCISICPQRNRDGDFVLETTQIVNSMVIAM